MWLLVNNNDNTNTPLREVILQIIMQFTVGHKFNLNHKNLISP